MKSSFLLNSLALAMVAAATSAPSFAQSAEKGQVNYVKNGCWQCHGYAGQGGIAGPKLAPDPKPYEFMAVFLRQTTGPMPPYSEKILSKDELADIYAFLKAVPKGPDYKSIPLLN